MPLPVTSTIFCGKNLLAPAQDIKSLTLHQELFGHQTFEILVPYDNVEGTKATFLTKSPQRLLGQPLTMELVPYAENKEGKKQSLQFVGVVTSMSTSRDTDYSGSIQVRGHSPLYLLTDGLKRRTFVKMTLKDIFEQILQPYQGHIPDYKLHPLHTDSIVFAAQYDETNFDFLNRLATEYGEWFYYDGQTV